MTALTNRARNTAPANFDGADPFGAGTENLPGTTTYMKFKGASGQFLAGSDEDEIELGTEYAADIWNAQWIWSFWWDGKMVESVDALLRDDPLFYETMPDFLPDNEDIDMTLEDIIQAQKDDPANFRDGWSVQASLGLRPVDGSDEEYTLRLGGSVSLRAFHALRKSYGRQYKIKAGLIPIVSLGADQYKSKIPGVGKRYAPVIKIQGWASEEELLGMAGENADDYEDEVPDRDDAAPMIADQREQAATAEVAEAAQPASTPAGRRGARGRNFGK